MSDDSDNLDDILNERLDLNLDEGLDSDDNKQIIDEKKEKLGFLMMSHKSKFRMRWDLIVIFLALYNCVSIPFEVAFGNISDHIALAIFEYVIDVLFFLDVVFNFRTTYINPKTGTEVTDWKFITANYVLRG